MDPEASAAGDGDGPRPEPSRARPEGEARPAASREGRSPKSTRPAAPPLKNRLPHLGQLQRGVLTALPCISVTELAERLDVTRPSASRALWSLRELQLVDGVGGPPGWKTGWQLTDLGAEAVELLAVESVRTMMDLLRRRPNMPDEPDAILAGAEAELADWLDGQAEA